MKTLRHAFVLFSVWRFAGLPLGLNKRKSLYVVLESIINYPKELNSKTSSIEFQLKINLRKDKVIQKQCKILTARTDTKTVKSWKIEVIKKFLCIPYGCIDY